MSRPDTAHEAASLVEAAVAYKLMTGREANSSDDLMSLFAKNESLQELRDKLFASAEFADAAQRYAPNHKPLDGKPANIEVQVPSDLLEKMVVRTEQVFRRLGETEPHWSVLTNEKFRASNIEKHKIEFFETGKHEIHKLQVFADRSHINLSAFDTCFELGCGVGRITTWLAELFPSVIACDIAAPLLNLAQEALARFGRRNVSFILLNEFSKVVEIPPFDVLFTTITLQHNPPPIIYLLLSRLLEKLRPGGIALFQLPTHATNYSFDATEYLKTQPVGPGIEIHVLPQSVVFELLEQHGCRTLEVREDGSCGPTLDIISNTFFIQKGR